MKKLKINPKLFTCLQVTFLLLLLKSPQTLFAFSDMNDSIAQEEVVKSLQRRIDSLELRFEKSEIQKNETKKSVFDWKRGAFANIGIDPFDLGLIPTTASGYMFSKTRRDSSRILFCPQLRLGNFVLEGKKYIHKPEVFLSAGLEKIKKLGDHVAYCDGWFVNMVPGYGEIKSPVGIIGGEYSTSLHFFFTESSSIGIGAFVRITGVLDDNTSWKRALDNGGYVTNYSAGLRFTISSFFLHHEPKSRSK